MIRALISLALVSLIDTFTGSQELVSRDFPARLGTGTPPLVEVASLVFGVVVVAGMVIHVFVRFVRPHGLECQELKWFPFTFVVGLLALFATRSEQDLVGAVLWTAVPLAVLTLTALAILRYRLYEIDRIVSRTVTCTVRVDLPGLTILALISAMAVFLPSDDGLVVAVATLAAAALFNPLRLWVQSLVDRRLNRTRYDSEQVIDESPGYCAIGSTRRVWLKAGSPSSSRSCSRTRLACG